MTGLDEVLAAAAWRPSALTEVLHGTTVGSNTLLQKLGRPLRPDHHPGLSRRAGDRPAAHAGRCST